MIGPLLRRLAPALLVVLVGGSAPANAQVTSPAIAASAERTATSGTATSGAATTGTVTLRTTAPELAALELYRDFLTLPNDANVPADLIPILEWLETAFGDRGFETRRLPTAGSDVLLAERRHPDAIRTVLVYLQADGQPVDPSRWSQESPWVPVLKSQASDGEWQILDWSSLEADIDPDWRIFARSASDSKGPIIQFLSAVSRLDREGIVPRFNLKVIVDTEEELGSPNLAAAVDEYRDSLAADLLVIFDGPPHSSGRPTLAYGARGIATVTLVTYGPRAPQHSGHYGNWTPNPALQLAQLLAAMKDAQGRVLIDGWYDGIEIDAATRAILEAVPDDEPAIMAAQGFSRPDAVADTLQEAVQYPSLNIRGLSSAWVGDQVRTIVPATATAELDIRLVIESDPAALLGLLRDHIEEQGFAVLDGPPTDDQRAHLERLVSMTSEINYGAFRTDLDSVPGRWLRGALTRLNGEPPIEIRTHGGSIPISMFVSSLGVPAVAVPTVNPDNNQHSPNENLRVGDFLRGIETIFAVLAEPIPD